MSAHKTSFRLLAAACFLTIPAAHVHAQATQIPFSTIPSTATTIRFETTPQGASVAWNTPAASIWSSLGVTFDGSDIVGGPSDIRSSPNILAGGPQVNSTIRATFNSGMSHVGAWGFDFVMEAYDSFGASLGAITHTDGSPGLYGGASEVGFLGFSSNTPITRVEFRHAFPTNQAFGYNIDDLVFKPGPPPPPTQVIAFTEFIEPDYGSLTYFPGDSGEELGFTTVMTPTTGLLPTASVFSVDGQRVYLHQSVNATTTFDTVPLAGYENVSVAARVNVVNTTYENDDSLRIFATNGVETIYLLNASGAMLTSLANDTILLYGASIPASWTQVSFVMASVSNSSQGSERYHLHGLEVRGTLAIPEPSTISMALLAAVSAIGSAYVKRCKNSARWRGRVVGSPNRDAHP